ncbi:protein translocase subunit SecD [Streptomyces sp. DSM 44915]|uniref:Protein translocase subunit SecD n=1 Tax=Streptomyces chisholmiae TaxID=3075540 RepID=A0ABU2JVZ4_9ACTN|nr:protein translocase subunit SecD [Streptomyces sp. DSM 44915]MDT0268918.1 protein translocase subunit SecD [Streptomyces sp. DSM 44915]
MATPKKDLRSSRKRDLGSRGQGKPGRALALILLIVIALTAGMFASGHTTPRLGIDLAGGTSITLTARPDADDADAVNATNLNTAVSIIERRVNGLGVQEAEVQTQGAENIIVNIPKGTDEEAAREQVGTTAQLGFRPVLSVAGAAPVQEQPAPEDGAEEGTEEGADEGTGEEGAEEEGAGEEGAGDGTEESTDEPAEGETEGTEEQPAEEPTDGESGDGTETQGARAPTALDEGGLSPASYRTADADEETPEEETPAEDGTEEPAEDGTEEPTEEPAEGNTGDPAADAAALQASLAALDCTTDESRLEASRAAAEAKDEDTVVACDTDGLYKYALGPVAVPGTDVSDANAMYDTQLGQGWIVQMEFNSAGAEKFADITSQLSTQAQPQNQFAIALDGEVVSAPSVRERLGGGRAEISGSFDQESSEELANILKYGALPLSFEESSVSTVSPMLGGEQLRAGLIAGGIGMLLVVLYMLVYYRGLSAIAIVSLLVSGALTYSIMSLLGPAIGFALNLPAVCGAIVAIGITADSFIVYFERIRDEIREGRTLRPAVERAWPRARRTILVSDFVSFLAAAVLFVVSVGKVQGFAFTLGLTTLLDVLVVFLFTKPLMTLVARRKFFSSGHPWSGLDPKRLGAPPPLRRAGRRPAPVVPSDPQEA